MDAIKLLERQHREVEQLFRKIENADTDEKERLFDELADALAVHATIEERHFYPATKDARTAELLQEAVEEHLSVKRLIADLLEMEPGEPQFDSKVSVLREQVEHHVEEEEGELFPQVKKLMEVDSLEAIGQQMEAEAEQLMAAGEPRKNVRIETEPPAVQP